MSSNNQFSGFDFNNIRTRNSFINIGSNVQQGSINIISTNNQKENSNNIENSQININSTVKGGDVNINDSVHYVESATATSSSSQSPIQTPAQKPISDQTIDLSSQQSGDTVFIVDGTEILAHKNILVKSSPVFLAIIKNAQPDSKIPLPGIKSNVFEALLKYLKDENFEIQTFAEQLLEIGQKYIINQLKAKCENILKQNISFDSAVKFLHLAEKNNAEVLKKKCIDYIRECPRIQKTDEYLNLMKDNPNLMIHFGVES